MELHEALKEAGRKHITDGMSQLTPEHHRRFALMYGRNNGRRSVEDAIAMSLEDILKEVAPEQLSWAMTQIDNTLKRQAT